MMVFVIGGSGSGKSSYAEKRIVSLHKNEETLYYLATMRIWDEEGWQKVDRHRKLRNGKGFVTIEQPTDVNQAMEKMEENRRAVLLECVSNLTANEMFSGRKPKAAGEVAEKIIRGITYIKENASHLVVVSSNVFEDGVTYDAATMEYIYAMGMINQRLAALCDQAVEVVAGIPLMLKLQGG